MTKTASATAALIPFALLGGMATLAAMIALQHIQLHAPAGFIENAILSAIWDWLGVLSLAGIGVGGTLAFYENALGKQLTWWMIRHAGFGTAMAITIWVLGDIAMTPNIPFGPWDYVPLTMAGAYTCYYLYMMVKEKMYLI